MNISITFRQMDATEAVKTYATEKVSKLQKFLRQPMHGTVTVSCEKRIHLAEVEIQAGGSHYRASEQSENMYASIDMVIDKLERQIRDDNEATRKAKKGAERASERLLPDVGQED